jgi:glycosyltransferase involved in cell wall biosynthesis
LKVLIVHDSYENTQPCGEDAMVAWETESLEEAGIPIRVVKTSQEVYSEPLWQRALIHMGGVYSVSNRSRVEAEIADFQPHLVHIHNLFPHFTPAVYLACRAAKLPIVQSLHNYRMLCCAGFLHRDGKPCEICIQKTYSWPAVAYGCVGGSPVRSFLKMNAAAAQKIAASTLGMVDVFIATSEHMREKYITGGFPAEKIAVKPSAAPDPKLPPRPRTYFCYAGSLRPEKGISLILEAWSQPGMPELRIAGTGPMEEAVRDAASRNPAIQCLGLLDKSEVFECMAGAIATLIPSTWDEPSPVVMMQSLSVGTPVITSDLGQRAEIIGHGVCGLVFPSGSSEGLEQQVRAAQASPELCERMGLAARRRYEERYSLAAGRTQLLSIYERALASAALK